MMNKKSSYVDAVLANIEKSQGTRFLIFGDGLMDLINSKKSWNYASSMIETAHKLRLSDNLILAMWCSNCGIQMFSGVPLMGGMCSNRCSAEHYD